MIAVLDQAINIDIKAQRREAVFFSSSVTSVLASGGRGGGKIPDEKAERTKADCKMER